MTLSQMKKMPKTGAPKIRGPWTVSKNLGGEIGVFDVEGNPICHFERFYKFDNAEFHANFIKEAGTVAHETGLTPRQLADKAEASEREFKHEAKLAAHLSKENRSLTSQRTELLSALESLIPDIEAVNKTNGQQIGHGRYMDALAAIKSTKAQQEGL